MKTYTPILTHDGFLIKAKSEQKSDEYKYKFMFDFLDKCKELKKLGYKRKNIADYKLS